MMCEGRWTPPLPARPVWLDQLDQPCMSTWSPRTCRGYDQRSPVDHRCMFPASTPHVCRCWRGCYSPEDPRRSWAERFGGRR